LPRLGHAADLLGLRARGGQRVGGSRLRGSGRRLERFQFADTLDQRRLAGVGIDRHQFFEHMFDTTCYP
jgi:hypothetical protein